MGRGVIPGHPPLAFGDDSGQTVGECVKEERSGRIGEDRNPSRPMATFRPKGRGQGRGRPIRGRFPAPPVQMEGVAACAGIGVRPGHAEIA